MLCAQWLGQPHACPPRHSQVLEVYTTWVSMNGIANDGFRARAFAFIKSLHEQLAAGADSSSKRRRKLILAVPPLVPSSHKRPYISPDHMAQLAGHVDGWCVAASACVRVSPCVRGCVRVCRVSMRACVCACCAV